MPNKPREELAAELNLLKDVDHAASPTTLYLAAKLTLDTIDSEGTEVAVSGYARLPITTATGWSDITEEEDYSWIANEDDLNFAAATALWGEIPGWALYDASTAGNRVRFGELNPHQYIDEDVVLSIPAGELEIRAY